MTPPTLRPLAAILRDAAERRKATEGASDAGAWSVEPHGQAHALYAGRDEVLDPEHPWCRAHGYNLMRLDDGDRAFAANIANIAHNADPARVRQACEDVAALVALVEEMAGALAFARDRFDDIAAGLQGGTTPDLIPLARVAAIAASKATVIALATYTAAKGE